MLPQLPDVDLTWHAYARCMPDEDGEPWAAPLVHGNQWDQKWMKESLCASCPVRDECLQDAFAQWEATGYNPPGVWGGTSPVDRVRLMAARRQAREDAA